MSDSCTGFRSRKILNTHHAGSYDKPCGPRTIGPSSKTSLTPYGSISVYFKVCFGQYHVSTRQFERRLIFARALDSQVTQFRCQIHRSPCPNQWLDKSTTSGMHDGDVRRICLFLLEGNCHHLSGFLCANPLVSCLSFQATD